MVHKPHPGSIVKVYQCDRGATVVDKGRSDMSEVLKYKGYLGSVKYCDKERMYHGDHAECPRLGSI